MDGRTAIALTALVAGGTALSCNTIWGIDGLSYDGTAASGQPASGGAAGSTATNTSQGGIAGAAGGISQGGQGGCATIAFDPPLNIGTVNSADDDRDPAVTDDELRLFDASSRPGGAGSLDLWLSTRAATTEQFGDPTELTELNTAAIEVGPAISGDGLILCFESNRTGGTGALDLWIATRDDATEPFGTPDELAQLNSTADDGDPSLTADGMFIVFASQRPGGAGGRDLWWSARTSLTDEFDPPTNLAGVNSAGDDSDPFVTADGLSLYFASNRPGGLGARDLYWTSRPSRAVAFEPPRHLMSISSPVTDEGPSLSADGATLYFSSAREGGAGAQDIWIAKRSCP